MTIACYIQSKFTVRTYASTAVEEASILNGLR